MWTSETAEVARPRFVFSNRHVFTVGFPVQQNNLKHIILSVAALADVSEVVDQLQGSLIKMENFQKLLELRKDLIGTDNLVVPGRVSLKIEVFNTISEFSNIYLILQFIPVPQNMCLMNDTCSLFSQEFIRLGCLSKLSGKGLQQRMFFLVTPHSFEIRLCY